MSTLFRSALAAALTSGLLLACAVDNVQTPPPGSKAQVAASSSSHARASLRRKLPSNDSLKPAQNAVPQAHTLLIRASSQSTSFTESPVSQAGTTVDSLGNPRPFLPIPDPHVEEGTPAPAQPQLQSEAKAALQPESVPQSQPVASEMHNIHQDERSAIAPQSAPPKVATAPAPSPYQRAMLGANGANSPLNDSSKLQSSFVLEVVFIVLIILCLAGAAWYRLNFDFGRPSRRPYRD
ncbi:MAG: hypothetical protein U0136_19200 [Bdellovibrionota bacterium]